MDADDARGTPGQRELQTCLRDLITLLSLPEVCHGRPAPSTLALSLEALPSVLPVTFAYGRLPDGEGSAAWLRGRGVLDDPDPVASAVAPYLATPGVGVVEIDGPAGVGSARLTVIEVGSPREPTVLALGSTDPTFPRPLERVVIGAASSVIGAAVENARLLDAARAAERRKDEFLARLGHELRNPLAPMVTALDLLEMRGEAGQREHGVIRRQLRHMVHLVDDLMDTSRITRGALVLHKRRIRLGEAIDRAVELAGPILEQRRQQLLVSGAVDVTLVADPERLAQVLTNLLTNAAKYTDPGGRIEVVAEVGEGKATLRVSDTGRGIAPEMLGSIFEPFVQAGRRTEALAQGLGLGLAIVKSIVAQHGGQVSASSDGPGRGSTFTVTLPLGSESDEAPARSTPVPAPSARHAPRVLVVDDNTEAAELLCAALRALGHEVVMSHDGPSALELARGFRPHAAVLDIGLPGMDGHELGRKLRVEHGPSLLLLAVTGFDQERDRQASLQAGFASHFVKPVDVRRLAAAIAGDADAHVARR